MAKKIVFHPYAWYKMEKRGITKADVEETMREPYSMCRGKIWKKNCPKDISGYLLRAIFEGYDDILR
ncbi:MAG: hypothetical protein KAV98_05875 [Dehalococcoidia bacterium]|nr:hypothetical protein [Dehalococcoidia bacterium]